MFAAGGRGVSQRRRYSRATAFLSADAI